MITVTPELLAAYQSTRFRVDDAGHDFVLTIGEISPPLLDLYREHGCSCAAFVTAWNPFSQPTCEDDNRTAQAELERTLVELRAPLLLGHGESLEDDWPPEPSILALGIDKDRAVELGKRFRQNAIVWCDASGLPELVITA